MMSSGFHRSFLPEESSAKTECGQRREKAAHRASREEVRRIASPCMEWILTTGRIVELTEFRNALRSHDKLLWFENPSLLLGMTNPMRDAAERKRWQKPNRFLPRKSSDSLRI